MEVLRILRKQAGWTQAEVAQRLGIERSTYAKYESQLSEPNMDMLQKLSDLYGESIDFLVRWMSSKGVPSQPSKIIPVLGDVAAGIPIEAIENIIDWEEIDGTMASKGEHFGLRLKGASMEPRMREGDVVIVRKQDDADTGDTAVVLVNGDSATVKKIKKGPSGISLVPNNPAYDPIFYTNEEIATLPVRIIGKVVELRAKL